MALDPRSPPLVVSDPALLERARLALQSLQFEEEAARYRAACAALVEAIADAEAGDEEPLKRWLLERREGDHPERRGPIQYRVSDEQPNTGMEMVADSNFISIASSASSQSESPWIHFGRVACERADAWFDSECATEAEATPNSLDFAIQTSEIVGGFRSKSRARFLPPHVGVSLLVHGLMIVALGWWVVTVAQPPKQLSISASSAEFQDVTLETVLEPSTSEIASSEDPEPPPRADVETLSIEVPQIAAIDAGVGPAIAESNLASMAKMNEVGGLGTNLATGAEFFGAKAAGNNFVFVVDCSPSMARDKAFESAKAEIVRSLSMLKPKQRFFIMFFGAEIVPIQFPGRKAESYLLRANAENLEQTLQWVQRADIQKEGRHPIDAMKQAIDLQPDGIFLLFDGDTKVGNWTQRIRDLNRTDDLFSQGETKTPIHVVHFFRDEFATDMKRLADENGGTYRFVPRPQKGR